MTWHVDAETVRQYQEGLVDRVNGASLEAHLTVCDRCRGLAKVEDEWLRRSWAGVASRIEPGKRSVAERVLIAVGVPERIARIVAVSPSLRLSFLLALVLVIGFAVIASNAQPSARSYVIFLGAAPLLPVAGVAMAYGRHIDPAYEMAAAAPLDAFRLLLLRAATVLTVSVAAGLAAWPLVPAPSSLGFSAWLLPALSLVLVTLALGSRLEMWLAASLVGGGWLLVVVLASTQGQSVFTASAQVAYIVLGVIGAGALAVRHDSYNRLEGAR